MNMNKRFLSLTLALVMILGSLASLTPVLAAETAVELSDIDGHWAEAHIKKAVEEGLVKGYKDGTFKPGNSLARAEMATILARAFELETEADLKDFTDVKSTDWFFSAMGMAVEAGIFKGDGDKLMPRENIRRDHAFATVARGLKLEKSEEFNKAFPDLDEMDQSVKGEVAALVNLGYVEGDKAGKLNPAGEITRAEMTKIVNLALGFKVDEPEEKELKVESVSAINAKTLEVKFNKEVDNTKATIEVVKSTIKQNVSKTTWAADNKSVQLEMSAKLMKGDYTVNVKGLSDEALTKTVTVEDEKVESIEILSDIAAITAKDGSGVPTEAKVGYQVKNQYGEDITKTTGLTTNNPGNITVGNGVVTLNSTVLGSQPKVGDKIAVALVHAESAKSATKVVTLSAEASVADIEIKGLYNKDGKELNEATNLTNDKFYLLVEAKDQYGNVITNKTNAGNGLIKSETNPTVVKAATADSSTVTLSDVTIDGKKVLGIELTGTLKAGESTVTLISTTTGKNAAFTIKVAETQRTDVVNLSAPALAVAGEDVLVPVSVIDKDGNAVTDLKVLNDTAGTTYKGVKVTATGATEPATAFVKDKDGNIFIKLTGASAGTATVVAQSSTFKVATLSIKVEKAAVAKTVRGLRKPLVLTAGSSAPTNTKALTVADVVVEDQYGREMETAKLKKYLEDNNKGILIKKVDAAATVVTLPNSDSPIVPANNTIKHNAGVTVTAGAANGTETLQFVLAKNDGTGEVAASVAEATVRVTDGKEYTSYEIAPIGKVQAFGVESATAKAFKVNGILNGGKVALNSVGGYTASISGGKGTATIEANNSIKVLPAAMNNSVSVSTETTAENAVDTEFTLKVTINATGEVLEQKFIVSANNRKVEDYFFTTAAAGTTDAAYKAAEAAKVTKIDKLTTATAAVTTNLSSGGDAVNVATIDQYGNKEVVTLTNQHKVTIVPEDITQVNITGNGTATATATKLGASDANVTLKIQIGNAVKEIKAVVK